MIARLYSNENFPLPVVEELRRLGHEVLSTRDAGKSNEGIPDDEVLRFAAENGRAVITHNRQDFIRLHRQNPDHAGIIVCTGNPDFLALATKVHEQLEAMESLQASWCGAIVKPESIMLPTAVSPLCGHEQPAAHVEDG